VQRYRTPELSSLSKCSIIIAIGTTNSAVIARRIVPGRCDTVLTTQTHHQATVTPTGGLWKTPVVERGKAAFTGRCGKDERQRASKL
jgi:hypothetical protein